jgi:hypothetical protein
MVDGEGKICEKYVPTIKNALLKYITKLLPIVRGFKEAIESVDSNLVSSCLKNITMFLNKDVINLEKEDLDAERVINNYIIFCVTWSIGANILENKDRITFKSYFEGEM